MASFEYTVRFADDIVSFPERDGGHGSTFTATLSDASITDESLEDFLSGLQVESFVPIAPHFRHLPETSYDRWGNEVELVDMTDDYSVTFGEELAPEQLQALRTFEGVRYIGVQPQGEFFLSPNDAYFGDQWALENTGQTLSFLRCLGDSTATADYDVDATSAWNAVLAPGCKIGVLDTGIRGSHEDLDDSYDPFLSETSDNCGHGTAISGVIAAAGDNSVGIAGIARPDKDESEEMLVVYDIDFGCVPDAAAANAGISLFANDTDYSEIGVVNESWGSFAEKWTYDPADRDARRNAYVKGLFLVAASGNTVGCAWAHSDSCFAFPAGFNNFVTAVSGLTPHGTNPYPAFAYNDIVAGSDNIVTTWNTGDDHYMGYDVSTQCGTSLSAPLVTGAGAMLLGANGNLTNDDIRAVLLRTAEDLGVSGRDDVFGHGQLQLDDAIDYVSSPNKVYHGTTTSFSATYLGSRTQSFANSPWDTTGAFLDFHVRVYELEVTASFAAKGINETVIDAWGRPRLSQGFPNDDKIDALLLTSYLATDLSSLGANSVEMSTYTYKVFAALDTTVCLGWYPIEVPGEGSCGASANLAKFDYTFVTEPASRALPDVVGNLGFAIVVDDRPGEVRIEATNVSSRATVQFQLLDVSGRLVSSQTSTGSDAVVFPTVGLPSGVYFAVARSGNERASMKIVIAR